MNTWIFSKNGQVTEPLDLASAKKYVVENNDAYGWQASYTQWLPVNSINEFSALLPERKVGAQLPQKIVDEFLSKEQALSKRLEQFNKELASGEAIAQEFEQEIANYKQLTVNLSDEVKGNINEIELQYHELQNQLNVIRQSVQTSQQELSGIVKDFNQKVSEKSVVKTPVSVKAAVTPPPTVKSQPSSDLPKPEVEKDPTNASVIKLVPETEPSANVVVEKKVETAASTEKKSDTLNSADEEQKAEKQVDGKAINTRAPRPTGAKVISTRSNIPTPKHMGSIKNDSASTSVNEKPKEATIAKDTLANEKANQVATAKEKVLQKEVESVDDDQKLQTKLESGVKNIFKSVFTKEEPKSTKNKFSDLVGNDGKSSNVESIEAKVEAKVEVEIDDEASKAPRRRRRR